MLELDRPMFGSQEQEDWWLNLKGLKPFREHRKETWLYLLDRIDKKTLKWEDLKDYIGRREGRTTQTAIRAVLNIMAGNRVKVVFQGEYLKRRKELFTERMTELFPLVKWKEGKDIVFTLCGQEIPGFHADICLHDD